MIGQTVSHYKILEKLGEGGMGVVYRAEDTRLKRTVALKFLPPELTSDEKAKARFVHEAQAASALDHPNICTIHEIDETPDGRMFMCMACYEGETLREVVSRKPMDLAAAIDTAKHVAEGLARAHEHRIFHRDLKSANIFMTTDGQVKVVDFGLAKLAGRTRLTETGITTGTAAYMSPEQARGEEVDARTDIWSLGVTLYEMVTGRVPFLSEFDEAVVYSILNERAEPVTALRSGVPLELERIITKCLEKDPADRYQTAGDLIADLRRLRRDVESSDTRFHETPTRRADGRRRLWLILGAVVVATIAAGVFSRYRGPAVPPGPGKTMLVVLPFENLGSSDDQYFAAGITEEITNLLASFGEIGVISRKSAVYYAGTDKSARQIGSELGVQYVLEGTVRWDRTGEERDRVRVIPELVRVSDDTRVWSEAYGRVIEDVFEIQAEIAGEVVEQLGLTLLDHGELADRARPTGNLEAYHAYLRGNYYTGLPHFTAEYLNRAAEHYNRAVALDPRFAHAYAKLSIAHAKLYYYRYDVSDERRNLAKDAVDNAVRLKPDLPEVRLAMGYYQLMVERDVGRALAEFDRAARDLPDTAEVLEARGHAYRQRGDWIAALDQYNSACSLSPRDSSPLVELALTYWILRRYPEALDAANRAIEIAPDRAWPYLSESLTYFSWRGASGESRKALELVPRDHEWYAWMWFWQLVYEKKYQESLDFLSSLREDWIRIKIDAKPITMYRAYVHEALGQSEAAKAAYETALTLLEAEVDARPADPRYHSSLGIAYAALGRSDDAVREGKRAISLLPLSEDALYGQPYVIDLSHIYTLLGDYDSALESLREQLSRPGMISVPLLEVDPRWARLHDLPEFRKLLDEFRSREGQ